MLKLVNFDQKIDSNNTGSFDEDEEHDKAFEMIRKRSKTYVPMRFIQKLRADNEAEDKKVEMEEKDELP
jgi:hypothetical protein